MRDDEVYAKEEKHVSIVEAAWKRGNKVESEERKKNDDRQWGK